jgi:hypothetical protein
MTARGESELVPILHRETRTSEGVGFFEDFAPAGVLCASGVGFFEDFVPAGTLCQRGGFLKALCQRVTKHHFFSPDSKFLEIKFPDLSLLKITPVRFVIDVNLTSHDTSFPR